jgi:hypothetical protein
MHALEGTLAGKLLESLPQEAHNHGPTPRLGQPLQQLDSTMAAVQVSASEVLAPHFMYVLYIFLAPSADCMLLPSW